MLEEYANLEELVYNRMEHSKTFKVAHDKFKLVCARQPIHREEHGKLVDVDLTPKEVSGGFTVTGCNWTMDFIHKDVKFILHADDGRVFESQSLDYPNTDNVIVEHGNIVVREAWPNVDLCLCIRAKGVEWYKRIKKSSAKHKFRWRVVKSGQFTHRKVQTGNDSKGKKPIISHDMVNMGVAEIITESFDKKVVDRNPVTRVPRSSDDVTYPVLIDMPDVSVSVGAAGDDGGQNPGGVNTTEASNYVGRAGTASNFDVGMRFGGVNIPQGATIDDAKLKVRQNREEVNGAVAKIYGVDVDNLGASPWTTIRGKTKTTNNAVFVTTTSSAPTFVNVTHNVTGPIQEIISRSGWSSGNGLGLIALNTGTPAAQSNIAMYDHLTETAPLLEINYTAVGGITSIDRGIGRGVQRGVARGV